ncbi:uncharacterized protein LOC113449807 [Pseudonaja textilis]|uniref:uncharacterized protein LOC113449807 n=1 Tax=Pseudonaja textilis TaxID=8673 RepID=UPI000EAA2D42|nr:uncharacterized protein LOC113449807 [Pseudonaja textilis]
MAQSHTLALCLSGTRTPNLVACRHKNKETKGVNLACSFFSYSSDLQSKVEETTNIEPELKMIFTQAGITQDHLKDKRTSKKIFEIIENQGGIQTVLKETKARVVAQLPCMSPSKKTSHHNLIQSLKEEHLKRAQSDYHLTPVSQEDLICQLKKGTPLKPVAQNQLSKDEGIVAALEDIIQKRHIAIPASGNEEFQSDLECEDDWDD